MKRLWLRFVTAVYLMWDRVANWIDDLDDYTKDSDNYGGKIADFIGLTVVVFFVCLFTGYFIGFMGHWS